ncbi:unnamed protein product [Paramecium pentaurelia]|uniref:Helicase ATP-binding domain-containing protein n=1 Tax=Paramecium pentaurelia TaxID=43138 RepID=A0A8S1S9R9_9CILI|nr:unnamed protein product [Paramecium pentaurelia]
MNKDIEEKIRERIRLQYPFPPYESQLDLSKDIYMSLAQGIKVSIFESPTGTGKSYALIEGALNYLDDIKSNTLIKVKQKCQIDNDMPDWFNEPDVDLKLNPLKKPNINENKQQKKHVKLIDDDALFDYSSSEETKINLRGQSLNDKIIYCSRTHSQLKQFINEIRRSKHKVRVSTIGSRQHLCVNQSILSKANNNVNKLNHLCKSHKKQCSYYKSLDTLEQYTQEIFDINDLLTVSKKCQSCPYYAAKELSLQADIICTPYQLLMESIDQYIEPIIIVDEAHNFGSALLQTESCEISLNQLNIIVGGIDDYRKKYHQRVKAKTLYYLNQLLQICKSLIDKIKTKQSGNLITLIDFMVEIGIPKLNIIKLIKFVQNKDMRQRINGFIDSSQNVTHYSSFECFCKFISQLILTSQKESILYIEKSNTMKLSKINNYSSFQTLIDKSRNLVFLGGTLQPLNEFEIFKEKVDTNEFIFKEYPHIISKDRCQLLIINAQLDYSFKQKNENLNQLMNQTNSLILDIEKCIPEGIVIFMQTYTFLEQFKQYTKVNNLQFKKQVFFDEKQNSQILDKYSEVAKKGAILLSVVGGSLSEGINFSDHLARAVIIFGVPYPNLDSFELKEQININGNQYYDNITMRAVNQCIGRVIRHKNDYGLLFLIDKRFSEDKLRTKFSTWLQNRITIQNDFKETNFFESFKQIL